MSGRAWPESVVEAVKGAINPLVPNSDGVLWMFTHEDGQEQPITLDNVATAALDAAADALAVDTEGEVARLRDMLDEECMNRSDTEVERDYHHARADAAEARLAEVAAWYGENHMPWHYTEYGVSCACGSAMDADQVCIAARSLLDILAADSTETVTPAAEAVCLICQTACSKPVRTLTGTPIEAQVVAWHRAMTTTPAAVVVEPSAAEVEAVADAVEAHPFVTLVVRAGEWEATCDGCEELLEGGSDMDIACRSHARHLARAALLAARTVAPETDAGAGQ